jgi:hypothetical protein
MTSGLVSEFQVPGRMVQESKSVADGMVVALAGEQVQAMKTVHSRARQVVPGKP